MARGYNEFIGDYSEFTTGYNKFIKVYNKFNARYNEFDHFQFHSWFTGTQLFVN